MTPNAGRLVFFALYIFLPTTPALADTRADVEAGIVRCRAVVDDRAWLDCVYGAAQPMRAKLGLPPAPQAGAALPAPAPYRSPTVSSPPKRQDIPGLSSNSGASAGTTEQQFGNPVPDPKGSEIPTNVNRIRAQMTSYSFDRYGNFTVTLANGQIWRQESGDTSLARWEKPAVSYVVDITRGAIGSYNLNVEHQAGGYKVKRVK